MSDLNKDFKYLSKGYIYEQEKPKRSLKRKLFIVLSFILILGITPSLIFTISELDFNSNEKVAINPESVKDTTVNKSPKVYEVKIEEAEKNTAVVIKNDSYWKISKRICGEGRFYLSISEQNNSKALFEGDTIEANCTL